MIIILGILTVALIVCAVNGLTWNVSDWRHYTCDDETFDKIQKHMSE